MKILVINPNTNPETTERIRIASEYAASPGTHIEAVTAPFGEQLIMTIENSEVAGKAVQAVLAERAKTADAVVIAAFSDPGLQQARADYAMPMTGIGEAPMREAARISDRFSIVTLGRPMVDFMKMRAAQYGVADKLVKIHIAPWSTRKGRPEDIRRLIEECRIAAEQDDVGAIVLGGGPLAGQSKKVEMAVQRPVLDGVVCAIQRVEKLLKDNLRDAI